jgi:two-component system CheB/CheR fusion protein
MASSAAVLDHVVVIGASAGGLAAIEELLRQLPTASRAAYVVAQHLSPHHPSQLAELLKRATGLAVVEACDPMPLMPGQVIVIPPGHDAILSSEALRLEPPEPRFGPSPSIDRLLESLAAQWGERGVAVVLSGTGSDGACGLRSVAAAGGLTLVQSPDSARFGAMPQAAIALGRVDLVAEPAVLGAQLHGWFRAQGPAGRPVDAEAPPRLLAGVAAQLKQSTGVDFSQYKESTLRRQVQRRMALRAIPGLEDYIALLSSDSAEAEALQQSLLVTVTSFFRDPESFAALGRQLERLLARRPDGERLRVWVPACATGEEAYSLGMLISELLGHPDNLSQHLKIFATDLDEQSLAIGRRGLYPLSAARGVPQPLFERFAITTGDGFAISKDLRSCLVFARHNICEDPPFPHLDLISCRNALIYFTAPLQARVIDCFGFSLDPGGLLFLGSSESLGKTSGFSVLNPLHRLYERSQQLGGRQRMMLGRPIPAAPHPQRPAHAPGLARDGVPEQHVRLLEALIRTLASPCLVVDDHHDLVEVIGDVSPFCKLPQGRLPAAAGAFLREELQAEARALFLLVRADRSAASSGPLRLAGLEATIRLQAAPLPVGDRLLTVLSFISEAPDAEGTAAGPAGADRDAAFSSVIERLERELLSSQDSLRRSMADLEQVNEELEASSEELQASSEELQSSNEELEASNEELQATNQELAELNQQLRRRSDELERLNNELENIQNSLSQGMVIVDRQLRISRFSPLAVRVFGLVEGDIGQPLIGVPTTVPLPGLREALLAVVDGEGRRNLEASSEDVAYLAQIMPYRDRDAANLGAIITLTDVSELVALRRAAEASLSEFTALADALDQVVWKRDHRMERFLYISRRIQGLAGWTPPQVCDDPLLIEGAIHADDRAAVDAARRHGISGWRVSYRLATRSRGERRVEEIGTVLEDGHDNGFVGTLSDITDQDRVEHDHRLLAAGFQSLCAADGRAVVVVDATLRVLFSNPAFAALLGWQESSLPDPLLARVSLQPTAGAAAAPGGSLRDRLEQVLHSSQPEAVASARLALDGRDLGRVVLELIPSIDRGTTLGAIALLRPEPSEADRSANGEPAKG